MTTIIKPLPGDSFEFRGVNLLQTYGIKCVSYDTLLPPKRERKLEIPFVDGQHNYGSLNFEERLIKIECDMIAGVNRDKKKLSRHDTRELALLLSKQGKLVLWDEPDKFYRGEIFSAPDIFSYPQHNIRSFTLEFICEPFAYREAKSYPIKSGDNLNIDYQGTKESPCIIQLTNKGNTTLNNIEIIITNRR